MATDEERERHSRRRKRKITEKAHRNNDNKGAFSIRIINPRKIDYKRERLDKRNLEVEDEFE